jgi:hypothetical protein
MKTTTITELEGMMIDNLGGNNFGDGPGGAVWSDSLDEGPHGAFTDRAGFGGIVSSLVKKGLASTNGLDGRDATVSLTDAGVAIYIERSEEPAASYNRVAVMGGFEFFQRGDSILRARLDLPVMPDGYRCGRFECYASAWSRFEPMIRETLGS